MRRIDESDDVNFYDYPKLVYHIDGGVRVWWSRNLPRANSEATQNLLRILILIAQAVAALTHYYAETIPPRSDILDICSSWVSHYPESFPDTMRSIVGTGMNGLELQVREKSMIACFFFLRIDALLAINQLARIKFKSQANKQFTGGFVASDLNKKPVLPFNDASFDVVTCVVRTLFSFVKKNVHR